MPSALPVGTFGPAFTRGRIARLLSVGALALAGLTCRDSSPMGPGLPQAARLSVTPHFQTVAGGPVVTLTDVVVKVFRLPRAADATPIIDTIAPFVDDTVRLSLSVEIIGTNNFEVRITARAGTDTVYQGTDSVSAHVTTSGGGTAPPPAEIDLHWASADTLVTSLRVDPRDTILTVGDQVTFRYTARRADNSIAGTARVGWTTNNAALTIDQGTGAATATAEFGDALVIATMGSGLADTTHVSATRRVGSVVASPDVITLGVGSTLQMTATVTATDGTPLPTRPVNYLAVNTAVATVSSTGFVTAVAAGTTSIIVSSDNKADTVAVTVSRKIPTITWGRPADISHPTALGPAQLNATATFNGAPVAGTFTYTPAAGTVLNAGADQPLSLTFVPSDVVTYQNATGAQAITVLKGVATLALSNLTHTYDGTPKSATVTSTPASLTGVVITYQPSGGAVTTTPPTAGGSYAVTATLTHSNYQATQANGVLTISAASQTITLAPIADRTFGSPPFTVNATASSGLAVSFGAAGACSVAGSTVTLESVGTCVVSAIQTGDGNWAPAPVVADTFNVLPAPVASVDVQPDTSMVQVGQSIMLSAVVKDAANNVLIGRTVTWTSGDEAIATVNPTTGEVAGVAPGVVQIFATSESVIDAGTVIVQSPPPSITATVLPTDLDTLFAIGATRQYAVRSFNGEEQVAGVYTWRSTNTGVATVNSSFGIVTAVAPGSAQLIVEEQGGTADTMTVVVDPRLAQIILTPNRQVIFVGDTTRFTLTGADALGNPMPIQGTVYWSEYDGTYAADVESDGLVTGEDVGFSTVYAEIDLGDDELEARALVEVVRRVARVEVSPSAVLLTAFGQQANFSAVAYDHGGRPIPDAHITWESVNPSVATLVEGATGSSVIARSVRNGVTLMRAWSEGTSGEQPLQVQQQVASLEVTPVSMTVDIGGYVPLTAIARDANNNVIPLAPGAVAWTSQQPSIVAVDVATGVAQGLQQNGGVLITATAGSKTGNALIGVDPEILVGRIAFAVDTLTILSGDTVEVEIRLNKRPAVDMVVDLSLNGANAVFEPQTVTFNAMQTSQRVRVAGRFSGTVHAVASTEGPYGPDTLALHVRSGIWFEEYSEDGENYYEFGDMNAGEEFPTRLRISEPAPAGGLLVRFETNTSVARVTPEPLLIPAGHLAADIVIRGVGAGTTSITPVVSGVRGTPLQLEVFAADLMVTFPDSVRTIGVGQYEWGTPSYYDGGEGEECSECYIETDGYMRGSPGAPAGTSANIDGGSSSTTSSAHKIEMPGAPGSWVDYEYDSYCGAGIGDQPELNLNSSANAYAYEQPLFVVPDYCVRIGTEPQNDLHLSLISSNRDILAVEENPIIRQYDAAIGFAVHGRRQGDVTVTATAAGWTSGSIPVRVTTPRLWIERDGDGDVDTLVLSGGYNDFDVDFYVGDSLMLPHPRVNSLLVRVTSSNPDIVRIDTTGVVQAGEYDGYVYGNAIPGNPGTAWLRLSAEGHFGDSIPVVVPARGFDIAPILTIGAGLRYMHYVELTRVPEGNLFISVTPIGGDSSTVAIDTGFTYCYGDCYNPGVEVRGYGIGTRQFVFSADGYAPETVTVNVVQPEIVTYPYGGIFAGQSTSQPVYVGVGSAVMTTMSEVTINVARISTDTAATAQSPVTIPAGQQYTYMQMTGVVPGTSRFEMTAPGFIPDTFDFDVAQAQLRAVYCYYFYGETCYEDNAYNFSVGFLQQFTNFIKVSLPQTRTDSTVLHVRSLQNRAVPTVSRLMIPASGTSSAFFGWTGNAVGSDTIVITDSTGTFAPDSFMVDVVPGMLTVYPTSDTYVQADQSPTTTIEGVYRSIYGDARNIAPGDTLTIELTSSDPSVMTVPQYVRMSDGGYFGVAATYVGNGTAYVIARDSAGRADVVPDTSGKITWSGPRLLFNTQTYALGTNQASWGDDVASDIQIQLSNYTTNGLTVYLRSTDPRVVVVQDSVRIPGESNSTSVDVYSLDTIGVVEIEATAEGYAPGRIAIDVGRGRIQMSTYDWLETRQTASVYVYLTDQHGGYHASTRPVTVNLTSSNPSVAATDSVQVTIDSGSYQHSAAMLTALDRGRTKIVVAEAGYPLLPFYRPDTTEVQVAYPELWISEYPTIGMAQYDSITINLPQSDSNPVLVSVRVTDPALGSVSPTSVVIPAFGTSARVELRGGGREGYGIVEASAPRYEAARQEFYAQRGYLLFQGISLPAVGDTVRVRVKPTMYEYGEGWGYWTRAVHSAQDISLQATLAGGTTQVVKFMDSTGTAEITSVRMEARDTMTHEFLIVGVGVGGTVVTATNPNFYQAEHSEFVQYPTSVTVTIADGETSFVPASVQLGQFGTITWDNQSTLAPHNLTFTTNPGGVANEANWTAGTRSRQFTTAGEYAYQCTNHPGMNGTVTVIANPAQ